MCAMVCESGSVDLDTWATSSLKYQRDLQFSDPLLISEYPGSHNSAISEAYGYGIEKYFISALFGGIDEDQGDDVGVGVCQYLSIVDQLRMGLRHIEVDVWWGPKQEEGEGDMVVCHSPVPLYPVGKVNRAAKDANLTLEWDPKNMSCIGTKRMFTDVLFEIKDWMMQEENKNEIVVIYIDTKIFLPNTKQITKGTNDIRNVFGDMVWAVNAGSPLQYSRKQLLDMGKRIIFENQKDIWLTPDEGEPLVFAPVFWTHQFGGDALVEFPNCSIEGDNNWYGKQWVRGFDSYGLIEAATRCGATIVSGDYMNPDDMKLFVWSWDLEEPKNVKDCVAMLPNGRWGTLDCSLNLPYACQSESSGQWVVDLTVAGPWKGSSAPCPTGSVPGVPHNGYTNNLLVNAAYAQTIWLNTSPMI